MTTRSLPRRPRLWDGVFRRGEALDCQRRSRCPDRSPSARGRPHPAESLKRLEILHTTIRVVRPRGAPVPTRPGGPIQLHAATPAHFHWRTFRAAGYSSSDAALGIVGLLRFSEPRQQHVVAPRGLAARRRDGFARCELVRRHRSDTSRPGSWFCQIARMSIADLRGKSFCRAAGHHRPRP